MTLLGHALVRHPEHTPTRWLLLLHGVFGMGQNFRTFARALVARVPDWGLVLPDLRGHGTSQGFAGPHDLDAAAADLDALVGALGLPLAGIAGHSFGGKVALTWLAKHRGEVSRAIVLDAMPGARPADASVDTAIAVLEALEAQPAELASREAFAEAMAARGFPRAIVEWLAMNVRRDGDALRLRLDLPAIRALLVDYFARDLWWVLEDPLVAERSLLVVGGRSAVFPPDARARAEVAAAQNPGLSIEVLPTAGHWLHADDPDGLLEILARFLA